MALSYAPDISTPTTAIVEKNDSYWTSSRCRHRIINTIGNGNLVSLEGGRDRKPNGRRVTFTKGQPFAIDNTQSRFRCKPPAQVQRDLQRAQKHREFKNAYPAYLSSMPLDREKDNPHSVSGFAANNPCARTTDVPSSVSFDPPTEKQCEVQDKCAEPADKSDCCVAEDSRNRFMLMLRLI